MVIVLLHLYVFHAYLDFILQAIIYSAHHVISLIARSVLMENVTNVCMAILWLQKQIIARVAIKCLLGVTVAAHRYVKNAQMDTIFLKAYVLLVRL